MSLVGRWMFGGLIWGLSITKITLVSAAKDAAMEAQAKNDQQTIN